MKQEEKEMNWIEKFFRYCLINQRNIVLASAAVMVGALMVIGYATRDRSSRVIAAKTAFDQWKKAPLDRVLTQEMESALKKAPTLRRALEAEIAQIFLTGGFIDKRAAQCIERLQEDFPLHAQFAKVSLLIEQKEYQKALEMSVNLKERQDEHAMSAELYAWNLLRVAFLQKQLQNPSGELAAWEEVKAFLQKEEASRGKLLQIGIGLPGFSLADFISYREREMEGN